MDFHFIFFIIIILFFIGILGIIINRKSLLSVIISIEIMLLSINIQFALFAYFIDDMVGIVFAILVLTLAAAESAIGLALLVVHYRIRGSISIDLLRLLKN